MKLTLFLRRDIPSYSQSPDDNTCGPQVIRMVADGFRKERSGKVTSADWKRILDTTMKGNLRRVAGTRREDLVRALKIMNLSARRLRSAEVKRIAEIAMALQLDHPVIVSCRMTHKKKRYSHYAVVVGIDEDYIYLKDPFPYAGVKSRKLTKLRLKEFFKVRSKNAETVWGKDRWGVEVYVEKRKKAKTLSKASSTKVGVRKRRDSKLPTEDELGKHSDFIKAPEEYWHEEIKYAILKKYPELEDSEWDFDLIDSPPERPPYPDKLKVRVEVDDWGTLDEVSVSSAQYEFTPSEYPEVSTEKTEEEEVLEDINPEGTPKIFLLVYIEEGRNRPIISAIEQVEPDWRPHFGN